MLRLTRFSLATALPIAIIGWVLLAYGEGGDLAVSGERPADGIPDIPISTCINLGGALEAPQEGSWGYTIRPDDLERIALAGFDTVRLPVAWSEHTSFRSPYRIDPRFFNRIDQVIREALSEDLTVILDVHHFSELMHSPDQNLDRLDAIWAQLSEHYDGWPDGLVFEFLNEPYRRMNTERVDAMNHRLLAEVRKRHPDRWVIMSGSGWGNLEGLLEADIPYDPRAITTFHYYAPHRFTHQGAKFIRNAPPRGRKWGTRDERETLKATMRRAADFRARTGMPVFLGEFGVYSGVPISDRAQWTRAVRRAAEAEDIPWCYYDWATSFRVYDLSRERWLMSLRHALMH